MLMLLLNKVLPILTSTARSRETLACVVKSVLYQLYTGYILCIISSSEYELLYQHAFFVTRTLESKYETGAAAYYKSKPSRYTV